MVENNSALIKNLALVGHTGTGKTSLVEALLYQIGIIKRLGKVEEGTTTADYLPEEIKRKVSVSSKVISFSWQDYSFNLMDTPGYSDFIGEVISALNVVDSLLFVVCGVSGVEVQTEIIADYAAELDIPKAVFINKLDRENSNFYRVLEEIQQLFDKPVIPLTLPIGKETNFNGYIDVLTKKVHSSETNAQPTNEEIQNLEKYFLLLTETVVERDEELLGKYLEEIEITSEEIGEALKVAIKRGDIIPVLGGSLGSLIGIDYLMEFIKHYIPEPKVEEQRGLVSRVFKTMADPYVGKLSFLRVFSGELSSDSLVYNLVKEKSEKISQIIKTQGKNQNSITKLKAGDIGVIPKLTVTTTGDILTDSKNTSICFRTFLEFPNPCFEICVEPKSKGDEEKLSLSLTKIVEEDPTLTAFRRVETKETILKGIGEMQLETALERLKQKFGVEVYTKSPKVPYRETVKKAVKVEGKHKKQTGGHGQYGHVWLEIEPLLEGEFSFTESIFGGSVPKQYIPAVEKGILEAMEEGVLGGYPVTNIKVNLCDGSYHNVDSSELAFKLAAIQAFKKGCLNAKPRLLEPVYNLTVTVPEKYMGDIISDINTKRGKIQGIEPQGKKQVINAQAPLEEILNYSIDLKSLTQGRGTYKLSFSHYDEVPERKAEEIIKK